MQYKVVKIIKYFKIIFSETLLNKKNHPFQAVF
ncbi:hypothetical protein SAMN05421638_2256 [Kaistella treverensis]|uniref:Uncharacterized protein n=1 Tax=Kaistella treverensis TaxID=631455 RepID=A0A1I3NVY5_9FLAO|nr:hypothetical protein SAMN05421638_2256 [Kaistella treverensis]